MPSCVMQVPGRVPVTSLENIGTSPNFTVKKGDAVFLTKSPEAGAQGSFTYTIYDSAAGGKILSGPTVMTD